MDASKREENRPGSPSHAEKYLRGYLGGSIKLRDDQILPLTLCLVQYGATCAVAAYKDSERVMAEKVDEIISFRRDPNNGAGLWAVFVNEHPIHHFRADQNVTAYMEKLAANMKAKLKIYDEEEREGSNGRD